MLFSRQRKGRHATITPYYPPSSQDIPCQLLQRKMMDGDNTSSAQFPAEIFRKNVRPNYIYQLPNDKKRCYMFRVMHESTQYFNVMCNGCYNDFMKKERLKTPIPRPQNRKVFGSSVETDPATGHTRGCKPINYADAIKAYKPVDSKEEGTNGFRLLKAVKNCGRQTYRPSAQLIVYRLEDDQSKCLTFEYYRLRKQHGFHLCCASCYPEQKAANLNISVYCLTDAGFSSDPRLHHRSSCKPILYKDVVAEYALIDNKAANKLMRTWLSKNLINTREDTIINIPQTVPDEIEKHLLGPGLGVIERKKPSTYFYKFPESDQCFRFYVMGSTISQIWLGCCCCRSIYSTLKRDGSIYMKRTILANGFLTEDPLIGHIPGCKPDVYTEVLKNYRKVDEDEEQPDEEVSQDYPVVKMQKRGELLVIYRLENDPTKCYTFNYKRRSTYTWLSVLCSSCYSVRYTKKKLNKNDTSCNKDTTVLHNHRVEETGFLDDPCKNHHPKCEPLCYENVMSTSNYVDLTMAKNFINGEHALREQICDQDPKTTEFPAAVIHRRNAVSFVYYMPGQRTYGYLFFQLNRGDDSQLYCSTCVLPGAAEPGPEVVILKSDGLSVEEDSLKIHTKVCKRLGKQRFQEDKRRIANKVEYGKDNRNRKYAFPLEKRAKKEKYRGIYRLKDDPSLCYRFYPSFYCYKSGELLVTCTECSAVGHQRRIKQKKTTLVMYRVTSSGFLEDPTLRHVSGCKPILFDDLMKEDVIAGEQETKDFFRMIYKEKETRGETMEERTNTPPLSSENDKEDQTESLDYMQSIEPNHGFNDAETTIIRHIKSEDEKVFYAKSTKRLKNEIKHEADVVVGKTFTSILDVSFFTIDEVQLSIENRTVSLKCSRDVSALGVTGGFLHYCLELPPSIDISSVKSSWDVDQITITANRIGATI